MTKSKKKNTGTYIPIPDGVKKYENLDDIDQEVCGNFDLFLLLDSFGKERKSNERARLALIYRFGLFGEKSKTLKAIGEMVGCSHERIRQSEARGIRLCAHPSREHLVRTLPEGKLRECVDKWKRREKYYFL